MGITVAQLPTPSFLGQETYWADDLPSMGRVTSDLFITAKAQPSLQNIISPMFLGSIWTDKSILSPVVLSAPIPSLVSQDVQVEMRSQAIRIEEIPEFEAIHSP